MRYEKDRFLYREYGWRKKGSRVYAKVNGRRYKKTSIVVGKMVDEILESLQYEEWNKKKTIFQFYNLQHISIYIYHHNVNENRL